MLQFNPEQYYQAYQAGQQRNQQAKQQVADSLNAIPQALVGYQENQKKDRLNNLLTAMKLKEQGVDPSGAMSYLDTGKFPQQQENSVPQQMTPTSPSLMPGFGPQMASAGVSDVPAQQQSAQPQRGSAVDFWHSNPHLQPPPPQQQQQGGFSSILSSPQPDYKKITEQLQNNDISGLASLPEKQRTLFNSNREFNQRDAERLAKANQPGSKDYSAQDLADAEKGNWNSIAQRNNGRIPSSLATLGESATSKADTAYEKKRNDAQNAMINVRGDQSIARTELQRDSAAMAYNTIERIKSENRLPTQLEYHDLLNQMLKARTGTYSEQAANDLDQKTLKGKIGNLYTYVTGETAPATTSALLDNLQKFVAESGTQAEKQHDSYMSPRQSKILSGLKPEDQQNLMNIHRGMSFQEQTGYKGKSQYQQTATNPKTGEKMGFDGKQWVPIQ